MQSAVAALIQPFVGQTGGLMRALHAVQDTEGYIDAAAIPVLAKSFNLTKAEVRGVVSFYEDFRRSPAGDHVIKICQAEACQAVGGRDLAAELERLLAIRIGDTTPDGRVTLEPVYCLGLCASGPALMIDGELKGRVNPDMLAGKLATLKEAKT